jgi:hypothetical protein
MTSRTEELIGEGPETNISESVTPTYYLRSSALAGYVINEIDAQGHKTKGYVYAGGERLAEQVTTPWYNTITWQHKNPMTGSWVEVSAYSPSAGRREMDPMGREVGTTAPPSPPSEPPPPTRAPNYIENFGGQTSEAELGMQLFEDFYVNKNYGGGAGPGQGGFWEQWNDHVTEREFQLMAGGHFGINKMNASTSGGSYEWVSQYQDSGYIGEDGIVYVVSKDVGYFRLVPGSGSPQKKLPGGIQFLHDNNSGNFNSYSSSFDPGIEGIVRAMFSDPCTKAFEAAGLVSPKENYERGVVIGPASLLRDSSQSNLQYTGITEKARQKNATDANSSGTDAVTITNYPGHDREVYDGRPRIFLNTPAFSDDLTHVLIHEFMHAGGAVGDGSRFGSDLAYLGAKWIRVGMGTKGEGIYRFTNSEGEIQDACR